VALCLELSFSSSFSFSFSTCSGGSTQRAGDARRPVRTEPLPTTHSTRSIRRAPFDALPLAQDRCRLLRAGLKGAAEFTDSKSITNEDHRPSEMDRALSSNVIGHHEMRLAAPFFSTQIVGMKAHRSIHINSHRGLLFVIPVMRDQNTAANRPA
jgi:hypothetical protein